jgi:hypothetical protein
VTDETSRCDAGTGHPRQTLGRAVGEARVTAKGQRVLGIVPGQAGGR